MYTRQKCIRATHLNEGVRGLLPQLLETRNQSRFNRLKLFAFHENRSNVRVWERCIDLGMSGYKITTAEDLYNKYQLWNRKI